MHQTPTLVKSNVVIDSKDMPRRQFSELERMYFPEEGGRGH